MVPEQCRPLPPKEQFQRILAQNQVVVASNGSDESKKMLEKLNDLGCDFTIVDIQSKPEYVEGLDLSFPYIFISGVPACGIAGIESISDQLPKSKKAMSVTERI